VKEIDIILENIVIKHLGIINEKQEINDSLISHKTKNKLFFSEFTEAVKIVSGIWNPKMDTLSQGSLIENYIGREKRKDNFIKEFIGTKNNIVDTSLLGQLIRLLNSNKKTINGYKANINTNNKFLINTQEISLEQLKKLRSITTVKDIKYYYNNNKKFKGVIIPTQAAKNNLINSKENDIYIIKYEKINESIKEGIKILLNLNKKIEEEFKKIEKVLEDSGLFDTFKNNTAEVINPLMNSILDIFNKYNKKYAKKTKKEKLVKQIIKIPQHIQSQYERTEAVIDKILTGENLLKLEEAFEYMNLEIEKNKISQALTISSSIAGGH